MPLYQPIQCCVGEHCRVELWPFCAREVGAAADERLVAISQFDKNRTHFGATEFASQAVKGRQRVVASKVEQADCGGETGDIPAAPDTRNRQGAVKAAKAPVMFR